MRGPGTELRARAELAAKCRSCGTCRSVCPVFAEIGTEGSVARGKVALIRSVLEGDADLSEIFEDRVLLCLNCKTCVANCPNSVPVDDLILAARHDLVESGRLPLVRRLIFRLLLNRGRLLPPFGRLAWFAQRWLLRGLPQGSPLRIVLPLAGAVPRIIILRRICGSGAGVRVWAQRRCRGAGGSGRCGAGHGRRETLHRRPEARAPGPCGGGSVAILNGVRP